MACAHGFQRWPRGRGLEGHAAPAADRGQETGGKEVNLPTRFAALAVTLALAAIVAIPLPVQASNDGVVPAHEPKRAVQPAARIDEQIGAQVDLGLVFRDEDEKPVTLGACMNGKPTILVPVYYRCPMLCTRVLN